MRCIKVSDEALFAALVKALVERVAPERIRASPARRQVTA